jgi:hypothetical protein
MALLPLLSFASGELDPILHDSVTLEKFKKGLATARNVVISKTGGALSRFPRLNLAKAKNNAQAIKLYYPTNSNHLLEWGHNYVRVYSLNGFSQYGVASSLLPSLQVELAHALTEDDLPNLHFTTTGDYVYVFCAGKTTLKLQLAFAGSAFVASADIFKVPDPLNVVTVTPVGAPSGYQVDYLVTLVINGEESIYKENVTGFSKPIAAGQTNVVSVDWLDADVNFDEVSEVRVYSRPNGGGAYGFLGATTSFTIPAPGQRAASFEDIGSLPDFSIGVQDLITKYGLAGKDVIDLKPRTGTVYQQRLIITAEDDEEAIIASRPGHQNNFYRDFPYAADSALLFKSGTSGKANVRRIIESDGLVVFTTIGVYTSVGVLSVNNLALDRRGGWVINVEIPPLVVPGGLFFVDTTNTIRQLIFSQEIMAYESIEQTIFSNHLFKNREITSWCYQNGTIPLIIVTFSDGEFASFTYNFEHQMRAWTRHDSVYPVDQVEGTDINDVSCFVVNKGGNRYIELSLPRHIPVDISTTYPEAHCFAPNAFMDSIASQFLCLNDIFSPGETFTFTPVTPGDWEGELTLVSTSLGIFSAGTLVGDILRWFNPDDRTVIDLEVTALVGPETIRVQPSEEYPSEYSTGIRLYRTYTTVTGLTHLEGESVSVMVDGAVVASPNNDVDGYPTLTVSAGAITLPNSMRGAIIHVGRPIVADFKTLNVSTVEQSPSLIESLNVSKLYIRFNETRGLFCSNEFPEERNDEVDGTSVSGMEDLDLQYVPRNGVVIGNRAPVPVSKRVEKTIPGAWNNNGQISIRQVDPYHFEILSVIPDIEVLARSNR